MMYFVLDLDIGDYAAVARLGGGTILGDLLRDDHVAGAHHAILDLDSLVALRKAGCGRTRAPTASCGSPAAGSAASSFRVGWEREALAACAKEQLRRADTDHRQQQTLQLQTADSDGDSSRTPSGQIISLFWNEDVR